MGNTPSVIGVEPTIFIVLSWMDGEHVSKHVPVLQHLIAESNGNLEINYL